VSSDEDISTASPEHFDRAYRARAERFARICRLQNRRATLAEERWGPLAEALADANDPALACIDAPERSSFAARIAMGLSEAERQAGQPGQELVLQSLRRITATARPSLLVHGTGSWALSGILRDGALVPGGDGMTGEVALTNLTQSDLFLCAWDDPTSLYAACAFAYMNAGWSGEGLRLSAVRGGGLPIHEFVGLLLFGEGEPVLTPEQASVLRRMRRFRTLEQDTTLAAAYDRALDLAERGELRGDGRQYTRRLGAADDDAAAFTNACATVVARMAQAPELMKLPSERRLAAGVVAFVETLKPTLLCPLPDDDSDEQARKLATLQALTAQFPVVIVLDGEHLSTRRDPGYPWSSERLVGDAIPASRIALVYVPLSELPGVRSALRRADLEHAMAVPLEELEGLRLVAEAVPDRV
jgi:hypothetical protein